MQPEQPQQRAGDVSCSPIAVLRFGVAPAVGLRLADVDVVEGGARELDAGAAEAERPRALGGAADWQPHEERRRRTPTERPATKEGARVRVALSARLRHRALARRRRALESGEVDEEKGERPFVCARQAGDGDARPSPQSVVQRAPKWVLRRPQKVLDVQRRPRVLARTPTRAMQRANYSSAGSSSAIGRRRRAVIVSVAIVGPVSQQSAQ